MGGWEDMDERVLLARWGRDGVLSFQRVSGRHLALVCRRPPSEGDWFRSTCQRLNARKNWTCWKCRSKHDDALCCVGGRPGRQPVRVNCRSAAAVTVAAPPGLVVHPVAAV